MRITVIGGGILGASTAWEAAQRGAEVTVIDAAHQGKATLAGAGIICPWGKSDVDPEWYALYLAGAAHYPGLIAGLAAAGETDVSYARVGALVTSNDPAEIDAAESRLTAQLPDAPEAGEPRRLSATEARELFPPLRPDLGALLIPGAGRVDARRLAPAMLRAAQTMGARVVTDYAALNLTDRGVEVRGSDGTLYEADEVIVTSGAWASQLLRPLGLDHPVVPQKGQIVHLGLPGVRTSDWPVVLPQNSHYLLSFDDSRVVIGATRETGSGFDYRVTAGGLHEVLTAGLAIAPGLADAVHLETRIGFRPAPPTIRPILGRVPGIPGLILGNGLGASGLTVGPHAGHLLARLALGEDPGLAPFAPAA